MTTQRFIMDVACCKTQENKLTQRITSKTDINFPVARTISKCFLVNVVSGGYILYEMPFFISSFLGTILLIRDNYFGFCHSLEMIVGSFR